MKYEYQCIEQIDLAAQQLQTQEPSFARFALILADNIVELMLYRKCQYVFVQDNGLFSYGKQHYGEHQYDAKTRAKVLSQHFDERPKFCRRLGVLDEREMEFILTAHEYRNEVYHVGLRHDDILYPIAWQYHELACDIFRRFSPLYGVWSSNDVVSATVARHTGPEGIRLQAPAEDIAVVTQSLRDAKPALDPPFHQRLSNAAVCRVDAIADAIYVLTNDGQDDDSELLRDLQFHAFLSSAESPYLDELSSIQSGEELGALMAKAQAGWTPKFARSPVERWRGRAEQLTREAEPLVAMKKFQCLLDEMESLSTIVFEAAEAFEQEVQLQIDVMRGK